jgi:hypothetical protein
MKIGSSFLLAANYFPFQVITFNEIKHEEIYFKERLCTLAFDIQLSCEVEEGAKRFLFKSFRLIMRFILPHIQSEAGPLHFSALDKVYCHRKTFKQVLKERLL